MPISVPSSRSWQAIKGHVYLVGAGPGDPGLLTVKALGLLQSADVVLYDRLVSQPVLDLIHNDATLEYVGKARRSEAHRQAQINERLVELAQQNLSVVRLKSGDPFIFGRGGEEIETLAQGSIPFEIVPGITAALGCAAYAGIPLTHRDTAQSVRFVTGHRKDDDHAMDWRALVAPQQTLVFYMALVRLQDTCQQLIEASLAKTTPAAIIERGTTTDQKMVFGTLESLPQDPAVDQLQSPTLLIIGDVVALHQNFQWFSP